MDREELLLKQMEYVKEQIASIEKKIGSYPEDGKGFKELVDGYNKWVDRYNALVDEYGKLNSVDLEEEQLELEKDKLDFEKEKFDYENMHKEKTERVDRVFRGAEIAAKILVPCLAITGSVAIAKLSYMNDAELKLCNGRIFGGLKEVIKLATMKL